MIGPVTPGATMVRYVRMSSENGVVSRSRSVLPELMTPVSWTSTFSVPSWRNIQLKA